MARHPLDVCDGGREDDSAAPVQSSAPAQNIAPAQSAAPTEVAADTAARERIQAIVDGPDFHRKVSGRHWRFKDREDKADEDKSVPEWLIKLIERWERFAEGREGSEPFFVGTASVVRFILAVILVSLLIYVLYRYRDSLRRWARLPGRSPI